MEPASTPTYHALKTRMETEWVPQMKDLLDLDAASLPVIWDADFLYGPKTSTGEDTYVLCEINVSAVWPYPETANQKLAEAAVAGTTASKAAELDEPGIALQDGQDLQGAVGRRGRRGRGYWRGVGDCAAREA